MLLGPLWLGRCGGSAGGHHQQAAAGAQQACLAACLACSLQKAVKVRNLLNQTVVLILCAGVVSAVGRVVPSSNNQPLQALQTDAGGWLPPV